MWTDMDRKGALLFGDLTYDEGPVCKAGHLPVERYACSSGCVACVRARVKARHYAPENRETIRAQAKARQALPKTKATQLKYRERTRTAAVERAKAWTAANPEKYAARQKVYYAENREHLKAEAKRCAQERKARDPAAFKDANNANFAAYRARKIKASTNRADELAAIKEVYAFASSLGCEVDHIVPLKNKIVCGLHNLHNLRLLPMSQNRSKGNKFELIQETHDARRTPTLLGLDPGDFALGDLQELPVEVRPGACPDTRANGSPSGSHSQHQRKLRGTGSPGTAGAGLAGRQPSPAGVSLGR